MSDSIHVENNIITLEGEGRVRISPDLAVVRLGVISEGLNLSVLQSENAVIIGNIINVLNQMGVEDISTYQYTVDKNYVFRNDQRIDQGYIVRNILEIRVYNMEDLGIIIDNAVEFGANYVESISFQISNLSTYYQEALNLAIKDGIDKARNISDEFGFNINFTPRSITEHITPLEAPRPFFASRDTIETTPILPGEREIAANVTLEFIY